MSDQNSVMVPREPTADELRMMFRFGISRAAWAALTAADPASLGVEGDASAWMMRGEVVADIPGESYHPPKPFVSVITDRAVMERMAKVHGHHFTALYTAAALHQRSPSADTPWKNAVIDAAVVADFWPKCGEADPRGFLNEVICWNNEVALDPRVSDAARKLIEQGRNEAPPTGLSAEEVEALDWLGGDFPVYGISGVAAGRIRTICAALRRRSHTGKGDSQ